MKLQFSLPPVWFIVHGGTDQPFPNPITEEEEVEEEKRSHVPLQDRRGRKTLLRRYMSDGGSTLIHYFYGNWKTI